MNLYNEVSAKVDYSTSNYNHMKIKLEELQKLYADLQFEYNEGVETLTQVNV